MAVLLDHRFDWYFSGDIYAQPTSYDMEDGTPIIECKCLTLPIQLLEEIFEQLPLVFENRYWVIQNRYCHFVATINYNAVEKIFGRDKALTYKVTLTNSFKCFCAYLFLICFNFFLESIHIANL